MYKKNRTIAIITGILLFAFSFYASSQNFEGTIHFSKKTLSDTSYFDYHVKGNLLRIDELDRNKKLIKYVIIDIEKKTMTAVNPSLKLFVSIVVKPYVPIDDKNYEIIKSENSKEINGFKCRQWRVRNVSQNTEITYWVAHDHFHFYTDLLKILNSSEKLSVFYMEIDDTTGFLPFEIVERTLLRVVRKEVYAYKFEKKKLSSLLFGIPEKFTAFKR